MEITRKQLMEIVKSHGGFIRLDTFVEKMGQRATPENLWLAHDTLRNTVLPALKQDCAEAEREEAVVFVSHRRRSTHGISDGAFPQEIMPDKPATLVKKKASAETLAKRQAKLEELARKKGKTLEEMETDIYIPGLTLVSSDWFNRDDEALQFKSALCDDSGNVEDSSLLDGAELTFCKAAARNNRSGVILTLFVATDE